MLKTTPDHIIILDRLVIQYGNDVEVKLWEEVKQDLKILAHRYMRV